MKSRVFLSISLLLLLAPTLSDACLPRSYAPEEYYMFRISQSYMKGKYTPVKFNYGSDENCRLWKEQTGTDATLAEIYEVVYKTPVQEIEYIISPKANLLKSKVYMQNAFARTLKEDLDAAYFLIIAKSCERARKRIYSPWFYPSSRPTPDTMTLEEILEVCKKYTGERFASRFALQAMRCLFSLERYDECISYWEEISPSLPDDIIKNLILRYVAGAYYSKDDVENARVLFGQAGDLQSLEQCAPQGMNIYELYYRYCPESPELRNLVERNVLWAEHEYIDNRYWDEGPNEYAVKDMQNLHETALVIASEGKVSDPALWYYTAAFIEHLTGDDAKSLKTVALAEKAPGSDYIKESIKVLKVYLTASVTPYSGSYESKVIDGIKWLDEKVAANVDEVRDVVSEDGLWHLKTNSSFFYWNDMMRKVLLGVVCPKMMKAGNEVGAIGYANMADNRLLSLVNSIKYYAYDADWNFTILTETFDAYRAGERFNSFDYSNDFFALLDTVGVDNLIKYVGTLDKPKKNQKFVNERSFTDKDYFRDIIASKLMREMRYSEAEKWLSQLAPDFQKKLNVYRRGYFKYDPFSYSDDKVKDNSQYKLRFASEMASLEKQIASTKDPDHKASLLVRYGLGVRNSIDHCWALTFYGKSIWDDDPEATTPFAKGKKVLLERSDKIFAEALATAESPEAKAVVNKQLGNLKTVCTLYPTTTVAAEIRRTCDTYADYHLDLSDKTYGTWWYPYKN